MSIAADLARLAQAQPAPEGSKARMPPDVTKKPRLFSGGGGLVATAADYLRFTEMLLNHGEYGNARLLAPAHDQADDVERAAARRRLYRSRHAVRRYRADARRWGRDFGLGFCVRVSDGHNPLPGSVGSYYWTGAWGTTFWVDPREKLIAIQMIQTPTSVGSPFRRAFRDMTYAAMTGVEGER